FLLMGKKYDVLAKHMVNVNGAFANDNDAIALLRRRTQRIQAPAAQKPDVPVRSRVVVATA
ncbi:MAG: fatty acid desaturase, partial [Cytophagaceae bacterium]